MNNTSQEILQQQWETVCQKVRLNSKDAVLNRWLDQMEPQIQENGEVCLAVPTRFMHEWMKEKEYDAVICSVWKDENPSIRRISLKIQSHVVPTPAEESAPDVSADTASSTEQAPADVLAEFENTYLDPHFTFENYVVGQSNEFAFAAAKRIADSEEITFNPLYLHSSVGLGKTHLMHAIAASIQKSGSGRRVLYLSAEKFMYQFVRALRFDDTVSFRDLFRSVDVLMIDDVQFICGKKATQEEFFHTFNALIDQGKQIVLSSDSSPLDLKGIEDRLKTRMAQGLVVDIHPTTYEMRIGILQSKAALLEADVPQDVIEFLAERITTNVRELEGALKRVVASTQLLGTAITLDNTKALLKDLLNTYEKELSIDDIQKAVADYYTLKLSDLKSTRRDRKIARPRQIAMYLSKVLTTKSLPEIGSAFDRDHTTIIHAVRTIEEKISSDADLTQDITALKRSLNA